MEDNFKHDPEGEEQKQSKFYRLPFALCKKYGIPIQDWWRPRDAWNALKNGGLVEDPSEEMKRLIRKQKQKASAKSSQERKDRESRIAKQKQNPDHVPDQNYQHRSGFIAGEPKGEPMSFEQANGGKVNPFYEQGRKGELIGYLTNCQTCVAAYVARRQGYNVRALPNLDNKEIYNLSLSPLSIYEKGGRSPEEIGKHPMERTADFLDRMVKEGSICTVSCKWIGRNSGHIVTAERTAEGVRLYDPQTGKVYAKNEINAFFSRATNIRVADVTGFEINTRIADRIMKGAKNDG